MLTRFSYAYGSTLYVQIWNDRLRILDGKTGNTFDESPLVAWHADKPWRKRFAGFGDEVKTLDENHIIKNPFDHPRSLIADIETGSVLLRCAMTSLIQRNFFTSRIQVILHPMTCVEGGLTSVEQKAFKTMAHDAGVSDVFLYWGEPLEAHQLTVDGLSTPQLQQG
ncbi:hypothetical protein [Enterovibrio norvegicus]|uniref:hypothetical protein n=1 Tax=Enterovibrio norvegicus TaxID=188144 RepID=UPI000C867629|nr:hypothetical protein [Enterovibrio norvegicus]PMN62047.1 hypothetical protein BCT27_11920 [Enterovibrio norvegicus]